MRRTLAALALAALAAAGARGDEVEKSLDFGGQTRLWLEHAPARAPSSPLPLVLVLHGGGGGPDGAARMSDMSALADREGFIALYPGGTGRFFSRRLLTWNSGNCCGYAMKSGVDDVGYLAALIERYVREGRADPKRVFVTGLSNGAMMAHRLACERADLVAAIAPVAGAIGVTECRPARPVSVLMIHGRADQHVPYAGGSGSKSLTPRVDRSVAENEDIWAKADDCRQRKATDGAVARDERSACRAGVAVVLLTHAGGHIWPGGKPGLRMGNVDPILPEPQASETIWDFFKSHPRR